MRARVCRSPALVDRRSFGLSIRIVPPTANKPTATTRHPNATRTMVRRWGEMAAPRRRNTPHRGARKVQLSRGTRGTRGSLGSRGSSRVQRSRARRPRIRCTIAALPTAHAAPSEPAAVGEPVVVDHRAREGHQRDPGRGDREGEPATAPRAGRDEHEADRDLGGRLRVRAREGRERVAGIGRRGSSRRAQASGRPSRDRRRARPGATPPGPSAAARSEPRRHRDPQGHHAGALRSAGGARRDDRSRGHASTRRRHDSSRPCRNGGDTTSDATTDASMTTAASMAAEALRARRGSRTRSPSIRCRAGASGSVGTRRR